MVAIPMRKKTWFVLFVVVLIPVLLLSQEPRSAVVISVDGAHAGAAISPQMYGIFFEDINFGADGGLYPELVKNRSFEFDDPLTGWKAVMELDAKGIAPPKGELVIRTDSPLNISNTHYLRVRVDEPGYTFYNSGFRGMGIESGAEYRFSAYVRTKGVTSIRASISDAQRHEI